MKLLIISNLYPPNTVGGYERLCFDVASYLAKRGYDIFVLTSTYGGNIEEYPDQRIERSLHLLASKDNIYENLSPSSEQLATWNTENITLVQKRIFEINPDIIFVWNLFFFDRSLIHSLRQFNDRIVFFLTDNWLISFLNPQFLQKYFTEDVFEHKRSRSFFVKLKYAFKQTNSAVHNLSSCAIFPSEFMRNLYRDAGIVLKDSIVIPHGINLPTPQTVRRFLGDDIRLLFAGRIVEIKGVHTLIEALPTISKKIFPRKVTLTIVGDAQDLAYKKLLDAKILKLGLQENITFHPSVAENELQQLFQQHDIYIFPSLYEPFSLTLIHALASGIPTVASNAGGNVEIVNSETGLLYETGNPESLARQVVSMIRDDGRRNKISENAFMKTRLYSFENMMEKICNYLLSVKR